MSQNAGSWRSPSELEAPLLDLGGQLEPGLLGPVAFGGEHGELLTQLGQSHVVGPGPGELGRRVVVALLHLRERPLRCTQLVTQRRRAAAGAGPGRSLRRRAPGGTTRPGRAGVCAATTLW